MDRVALGLWLVGMAGLIACLSRGGDPEQPFPPELVRFAPAAVPVFAGAGPGHWDARIRERGWIRFEKGEYRLWYTGYDGSRTGRRLLGLATSRDGMTWHRHPGNPLVREHWIEDGMIVKDGDSYHLFAEGEGDQAHAFTSPDGIRWTRVGSLDVRRRDGTPIPPGPYGTPTVFREGDDWYLFYERSDLGIWLAHSRDRRVWRHVRDEPVLRPGPAEYDRDWIALNQIVPWRGRYYAFYHGTATTGPHARQWSSAVAVSRDLRHWEKYPGNPLFPASANWSSPVWLNAPGGIWLVTMHPEVRVHRRTPR